MYKWEKIKPGKRYWKLWFLCRNKFVFCEKPVGFAYFSERAGKKKKLTKEKNGGIICHKFRKELKASRKPIERMVVI